VSPATPYRPSFGAWHEGSTTRFRVWAPTSAEVTLEIEAPAERAGSHACSRAGDGCFVASVPRLPAGARYRYRLDGRGPFPDAASRHQPDGVHGPSAIVDPRAYAWQDAGWRGRRLDELTIYELHVGTFSPEGTFAGVEARLSWLADLGVGAIELMPVADFAGRRNWGYDGVALFAPARCYGTPDDLRRLVDAAHRAGLAVLLDVVYNHLGPDGAYAHAFSPYYFSARHTTPWGDALNLDGEHSALVRAFCIDNALHWIHEYHLDGLRLDATHALVDRSPRHFLAELAERVHESAADRHVLVIAEDHRNLAHMVRPAAQGGWGLDAVWADDFHHQVRRLTAGDHEGYFRDFSGTIADLAATIRQGWFFTGQPSIHLGRPRGTPADDVPSDRFVVCIQNHDQVGNRACGERLHHQVDPATWRAASALLLLVPETPLLFMGQEWAASTPFLFFTDFEADLGRLVTEGRRKEFQAFAAFRDPAARERIPDPQAFETFARSRLDWSELTREAHAAALACTRALLRLRREQRALRHPARGATEVAPLDDDTLMLWRAAPAPASFANDPPGEGPPRGELLAAVVALKGAPRVTVPAAPDGPLRPGERWTVRLTTEEPWFDPEPRPPRVVAAGTGIEIAFERPGAVVLVRAAEAPW